MRLLDFSDVMGQNLVERVNHIFDIFLCHGMKHGQADQPLVGALGYGIAVLTRGCRKSFAIVGMFVNRNIVHVDTDILSSQRAKNFCAPGRK
jgi:hypothetical protein